MTPQGVRRLIEAANIRTEVAAPLIIGHPTTALKLAKKHFPEESFEINEKEIEALRKIQADGVPNFAEACIVAGLTKER